MSHARVFPSILLSFLLILSVLGAALYSSGCLGGGGEKEKEWLQLVPKNAVVAGVFDMGTIKEEAIKDLLTNLSLIYEYNREKEELLNETGIDIEEAKRLIFVVENTSSEGNNIPEVAYYLEVSVDVEKFEENLKKSIENSNARATKTNYRGVSMYYSSEENFAVAYTEDYIVAGAKDVVEEIIDLANDKGEWAKQYKETSEKAGEGNLIIVGNAKAIGKEGESTEMGMGIGGQVSASLKSQVEFFAFRFAIDEENYSFRVVLKAEDEAAAEKIKKTVEALITLQQNLPGLGNVSGLPTPPYLRLLSNMKVSQDGAYVLIDLSVSSKDIEEAITSYFGPLNSWSLLQTGDNVTIIPINSG